MSSCIQPFRDLIEQIPDIEKPENTWERLQGLNTQFNYTPSNLRQYRNQVLYNILHYSAWPQVKERVDAFLLKTGPLTTADIVEHKLEPNIEECYKALKEYIDLLSYRLKSANILVERLFALKPGNIAAIAQDIMGPASEIVRDINGVQGDEELRAALQAALAKKNLHKEAKEAGEILADVRRSMAEVRKKRNLPEPATMSQNAARIQQSAQEVTNKLHREVLEVEKRLTEGFWNKDDIQAEYIKTGANSGFRQASEDFYRRLIAIATFQHKNIFTEGTKVEVTSNNAVHLLHIVTNAQRKISKLENGFYIEFALWVCVCVLLGGVGCLTYYAYELHIKPLRLGIALGLISISILGLVVRNWYQQKKIRNIIPKVNSVDAGSAAMIADPTAIDMSPLQIEPAASAAL